MSRYYSVLVITVVVINGLHCNSHILGLVTETFTLDKVRLCGTCHIYLLCYSDFVNLADETLGRVRLCAMCHIKKVFNLLCYSDFVSLADETCTLRQSETLCNLPHYFFYYFFISSVIAILLTLQMRPAP